MGVTEVQSYFTQIINHNSVNIHWICTKLGMEICFIEPLSMINSSLIGICICALLWIWKSMQNDGKEKNKEIETKLWPLVSRKCHK